MSYTNFNNYGVQRDGTRFRLVRNTIPLQVYELVANPNGVATVGNITIDEDYLATIYPVFQVRIDNNLVTSKVAPNNTVQLDLPDASHSRIDAIYVTDDGSYGKVTGDAVESAFPPDIPDGTVRIANVFVYYADSSAPIIDIMPVTEYYKNTGGEISGDIKITGGYDFRFSPRLGSRDTGDFIFENPDGTDGARLAYGGADGDYFGVSFQGGAVHELIHTGNIVDKVIDDDTIEVGKTLSSSKITSEMALKANLTDITEDIIIAFGDPNLSGNNYTNLALVDKTVQLAYTNNSGPQLPYVTFNSSGVGVLPDVPENGNPNSNITIRGTTAVMSEFYALEERVDKIPYHYYDFQDLNTASIVKNSINPSATTFAIVTDGLKIINNVSTVGTASWYSNLGVDNSKDYYAISLRFKTETFVDQATFGIGFGTYNTSLNSIGFRNNGQLTSNVNGTVASIRPALPTYAFVAGDTIGLDLIVDKLNGKIKDITTLVNGVVKGETYSLVIPDFSTLHVYCRTKSTSVLTAIVNQLVVPVVEKSVVYYVDDAAGLDTNKGTVLSPFKTISRAILSCVGLVYSKIIICEGKYRESLDFSVLTFETVEILARTPDVVQVMGSNAVIGWTKTSGKTNVYQAAFTTVIPVGNRIPKHIYEHGLESKIISASERDAMQKNMTYRLPFTPLVEVADVNLCDTTQGSFFNDVANSLLYIHSGNSSSPLTNGFSYENIVRPSISVANGAFGTTRKGHLILKSVQFLYTNNGVKLNGWSRVERYICSAFASLGTGSFIDDAPFTTAYKDEAAFCDSDGVQGHYNNVTGYTTQDQREGVMTGLYIDSWCHDNFDDGLSFHERSDITVRGGLFEYNADGGIRQSGDCNMRVFDAKARRNGWDDPSVSDGSGFDCLGTPSTGRNVGSLTLFNCISENNRKGIATMTGNAVINAYNCVARNNSEAEYYGKSGVLNANNCKATNSDPTKIKVIDGGTINVINDNNLT